MKDYVKKISIKDVAKKAGVSMQTISNYLNNRVVVSDKLKDKIKKAINKLEYTPNVIAKSLRTGKSHMIGVLIPEIENPFYSSIITGIQEKADSKGYTIILEFNNYENDKLQKDIIELSKYVDGIIICTNIVKEENIKKIYDKKVKIVGIDFSTKKELFPIIEADNYNAAYKGVKYLINMGHKNIYYISEPLEIKTIEDRWRGFKDCLIDHKIYYDENKIFIDKRLQLDKIKIGEEIIINYKDKIKTPAAIFGTSDLIIIGAMKAIENLGYLIPKDVSFLGYDNIYFSNYTKPPLSTIEMPTKKMGMLAVELLIDSLYEKRPNRKKLLLKTRMVERESVAKLEY